MLYTAFDHQLPENMREENRPGGGFYPENLRKEIDAMNEWVYHTVNNGVYKTGFATTQEAYESNLIPLFQSLDRLEEHLGQPGHSPYLFGENITEADIRLYTTCIRFDVAYYNIFKCNLKMIRHEYPRLDRWLRTLYWDESDRTNGGAFKKTTDFHLVRILLFRVMSLAPLTSSLQYKVGYLHALGLDKSDRFIVPLGPSPDILPPVA